MKKLLFTLTFLPTLLFSQQITIASNDIENIYTQAIDARFSGDLAKSRFLLESLKENNYTNEFVMSLLLEVYIEYLHGLIQQKDQKTFQIAYPGIRENIAQIWDIYPNSTNIQNLGLRISIIANDFQMGQAMASLIFEKRPLDPLANYVVGITAIIQKKYQLAIPYLKKIALVDRIPTLEPYIYQANIYLGDLFLEQNDFLQALKHYQISLGYMNSMDINIKIAVIESYLLNLPLARKYFQDIPLKLMNESVLNVYIAVLWLSDSSEDKLLLNTILSKNNPFSSEFLKAITQSQLGRTQKALKILENEKMLKNEFPGLYYSIQLKLFNRLGQKDSLFNTKKYLGEFHYDIQQYDIAKSHLQQLDRSLDKDGLAASILGSIAVKDWDYRKAQDLYRESLKKSKKLSTYIQLTEVELSLLNFEKSRQLIDQIDSDPFWKEWLEITYLYEQNKFQESLTNLLKLKESAPSYPFISQLLSSIYLELNEFDKAQDLIIQIYNHEPYNIINKNLLAYFYAETQQNLDKALALALEVVNEKPKDIIYLDTLAWIYTQQKNYPAAQEVFDQIVDLLDSLPYIPNSEEIYAHLGYFYFKIGNQQKSLEYFNKGLSIDPTNTYIKVLKKQFNIE